MSQAVDRAARLRRLARAVPGARKLKRRAVAIASKRTAPPHPELVLTEEDKRYLGTPYSDAVPLPPGAENELSSRNPRLRELRDAYGALELSSLEASQWRPELLDGFLDLRHFRGDSLITWHFRELPRATSLKYFIYATYVRERDHLGLLEQLGEDGAFGCWTFSYPEHPLYSRDLLESVNEIYFLDRELALRERERFSVLDIGAGYGRLAHRMTRAYPQLDDYCCVDAIAESSFLCEYYLRFRGCSPPARSVPLDRVESELEPGSFDLAVNIHSFSECTYAAVEWWLGVVERLEVPNLLIIPNEPTEFLTLEVGGSRRDFMPLIEQAGYRLASREPAIQDAAARELVRVHDHFHLFTRSGS